MGPRKNNGAPGQATPLCFDFGGIGEEDMVRGVVLSMVSVQVLEMQRTKIGTGIVDIVFRQTPQVSLRLLPFSWAVWRRTYNPHDGRTTMAMYYRLQ